MDELKKCTFCKVEKPLSEFDKNNKTKDGLRFWCKKCVSDHYHKIKNIRYEKIPCECGKEIVKTHLEKHKAGSLHRRRLNKIKKCSMCQNEKPLIEFHKNKSYSDGYNFTCKECLKKQKRVYEKVECECGLKVVMPYLGEHKNRSAHIKRMNDILD